MNKLFVTMLSIAINANLIGQTSGLGESHQLSLSLISQLISDEYLGLNLVRINSTGFNWSYSNKMARQQKSIAAGFEYGTQDNLRSSGFSIEFKNAFSIIKSKRLNNYLGYSFKSSSQFISADEKHSWVSVYAVSLYNSFNYSWEKNTLSFDISIPVAGLTTRPEACKEYDGSVNSMLYNSLNNPVFTSFHNYQGINLSLQYAKYINRKVALYGEVSSFNQKITFTESKFQKREDAIQMGLKYFFR